MTEHGNERTIGVMCFVGHAIIHTIKLAIEGIDLSQLISDIISGGITSLICGVFGAMGAFIFNKIKALVNELRTKKKAGIGNSSQRERDKGKSSQ